MGPFDIIGSKFHCFKVGRSSRSDRRIHHSVTLNCLARFLADKDQKVTTTIEITIPLEELEYTV